jgi:hypothetical protein
VDIEGERRLAVVGAADHAGWANLVTVGVSGERGGRHPGPPIIVDRRRCTLLDPELPRQPYHAAEGVPAGEAEALVARVVTAAREGARSALAALVDDVARAGSEPGRWTLAALTVRANGARSLPDTVAGVLASHAAMHAAEGQLYRDALAEAAADMGLDVVVHARDDTQAIAEAAAALGTDADTVAQVVAALGSAVGPPWRKEHRLAAAAALAELARCTQLTMTR